jgi:hypothetical protein
MLGYLCQREEEQMEEENDGCNHARVDRTEKKKKKKKCTMKRGEERIYPLFL